MKRSKLLSSTVLTVAMLTGLAAYPSAAAAQVGAAQPGQAMVGAAEASGAVTEVVVTARKREERLLDVPISIEAFTRAEIKAAQIDDIQTLAPRAGFTILPQVSTGAGGRAQGAIVFRGLQGVTFSTPQQNSGSLFIDGIFISGAPQSVNTADVERIEVLKGPQNAYFGRSTFGGAVNFITRKPSDELEGEVNARANARGTFDGDASVEGPLIKGVLDGRLTVFDHDKVAEYRASDGGKLGAEQTRGFTGTLMYKPTSDLWFRVRGTYQRDSDSAADQAYIPARLYGGTSCTGKVFQGTDAAGNAKSFSLTQAYFCNGIPTLGQLGTGIIDASTVVPPNLVSVLATNSRVYASTGRNIQFLNSTPRLNHSGLEREIVRGSLQGGYKLPYGATLDFNIGYNNSKATYAFDIDHSSNLYFYNVFAQIDEDFTADVRLASDQKQRLRGLIGASYFTSRNASDRLDDNLAFGAAVTGPSESLFSDSRNTTPSVYGSIEYDIFSFLTATFEGRYESEQDLAINIVKDKTGMNRYKQTFNSFLPRAIVKYHPLRNFQMYASYSEGAQPATLNSSFVSATSAQRTYIQSIDPSQTFISLQPTLSSYELGMKQQLFNNRVEYSLAIYQLRWNNELTNAFILNPASCRPPLSGLTAISNTAACPLSTNGSSLLLGNNARIRGVEFETSAHVNANIDLSMTLDYKDPIWTYYHNPGLQGLAGGAAPVGVEYFDGNTLSTVPNLQATFTGAYHRPVNDVWSLYARGDVVYTGKQWDSNLNLVQTNDFARVNVSLGLQRTNVTLELFATNLLDDKNWDYVTKVADVTEFSFAKQGVLAQPAQRREVGLRLQYKFH